MNSFNAKIFVPKPETTSMYNLLGWSSWALALAILFVYAKIETTPSHTITYTVIALVIFLIVTPLLFIGSFNYFIFLPLNGLLDGALLINDNELVIDKKRIDNNDIQKIDFRINDYYGKREYRGKGDFRPCLSQGVNNQITLETTSGRVYTIYFRIESIQHKQGIRPFIEKYIKDGKINFLTGAELLEIKGYDKIQNLKARLLTS
jgi:hypothetical protein